MFLQLFTELTALFLIISFGVALLTQRLPPARIQSLLGAQHGRGYVLAAGLGAVTPFCSCSTIPMLVGLLRARAGFGPTMTFLFTSPLLNPIVVALFVPVLGWQVTAVYAGLALGVSLLAGWALERLQFDRYVRAEMLAQPTRQACGAAAVPDSGWRAAWEEAWSLFRSMFPWMLIAMVIGALVHGFVPGAFFAEVAGADNPLAVPLAAVIGIPIYMRVTALLPLVAAFLSKGVSIGAIMALTIGSGGASLPEMIMLNHLFHWQLLAAFLVVIFVMAVSGGLLVNALFA